MEVRESGGVQQRSTPTDGTGSGRIELEEGDGQQSQPQLTALPRAGVKRPSRRSRPYLRPAAVLAVAGATMLPGTAAVYAAVAVHGRAALVVQQTEAANLDVSDVHLLA
jgi:hypothetical protein